MTQRQAALKDWLAQELGRNSVPIAPASTDASFRHYYRIEHDGRSLIVMDAPPDKEDTGPFMAVSRMLRSVGLNAPQILSANPEQGFLLLTDLDTQSYLSALNPGTVDKLYTDAMQALYLMQTQLAEQASTLPDYDTSFLLKEMELFREWYLERHCGLRLTDQQHTDLDQVFHLLAEMARQQPRVFVHRDYHSRNLMVTPGNNPGILDFQDAMFGPITYDLVSLLRDCYVQWPQEQVRQWALNNLHQAQDGGLIDKSVTDTTLLQWFDWMGVQRHLKASGIFSRLKWRDDKAGYLGDIPRTLGYVREVCVCYPALEPLGVLLASLES